MRGFRSLSIGLVTVFIVTATVFGALALSVRGQPITINELPMPTVTLQFDVASPTSLPTLTGGAPQVVPASVTASPTTTPTPTICPIPPDWQRYIVGPFDTLNSIAQQFNLTPDQLAQSNCLGNPVVTAGQTIYVPGFKPTPTSVPCSPPYNWTPYIVQPGDTLGSIAARYGISVYVLMRANCLNTTYIYYGQLLHVPWYFPVVTSTPVPIIPTFTPTPPIASLTPTIQPTDTPVVIPTTPAGTVMPGPTDTPATTDTPAPTHTLAPTVTPTELPPPTSTPAPPSTNTSAPPPTSTSAPPSTSTSAPPPTNTSAPPTTAATP